MQEVKEDDSVCRIRTDNREILSSLRKRDREHVLRQRRLTLVEAEALTATITLEQFKELVLKMKQKKPSLDVLKAIKNNLHTTDNIEAFFKTNGALSTLIRLLVGKDAFLQLESAACLTNLACGPHKSSYGIAKGAGAYLVSFITGGSTYLQDQSAWAAGNIANDCLECFSLLKAQGILPALLLALKSPSSDVIQSATFALRACTKYGDPDLIELATPETTKSLFDLVKDVNTPCRTRSDAAYTLANIYYLLVQNNPDVDSTVVEPILCLLCSISKVIEKNEMIALPLVRCLGFLSTCDSICQYLSQYPSFYDIVTPLLSVKILKRELLWIVTNIVSNSDRKIPDVNIVLSMIDFLNSTDALALPVLYFLCILVSQNENMKTLLHQADVMSKINILSACGEKSIESACNFFSNLL